MLSSRTFPATQTMFAYLESSGSHSWLTLSSLILLFTKRSKNTEATFVTATSKH